MREERTFHEMMQRYNQELLRMRQQARTAKDAPCEQEPAPTHSSRKEPEARIAFPGKVVPGPALECRQDRLQDHSLTVGSRGPVLLEDTLLHETLETFVHTKTIERAVHTKGYGAFGHFQLYRSMAEYTAADFLQDPARPIPTVTRFSFAVSNQGTPDTARNVRGFSTKFYLQNGVFDLLCNHIPVFLIRDGMRFPEAIASLSPSPVSNLPDGKLFWNFMARSPQATHFLTWLYSDAGTVASFRTMRGYGVNTYIWRNAAGKRRYVKYHWIPAAGETCIDAAEAGRLACENPNVAGQDLWDTLARGGTVEYELNVQLMDPQTEHTLSYDPLDDTKIWSEEQFPLMPVGKLTLERNPENYAAQVEKLAFSPANLVDGIEFSDDKMLQGRSFIYWDAQRRRLGPDFRSIPVNHMENWKPADAFSKTGLGESACGEQVRTDLEKADDFTQAGERYRRLSEEERSHLVENIAADLKHAAQKDQICVLGYLQKADETFCGQVQAAMGQA